VIGRRISLVVVVRVVGLPSVVVEIGSTVLVRVDLDVVVACKKMQHYVGKISNWVQE
jgi:hypothetical protein